MSTLRSHLVEALDAVTRKQKAPAVVALKLANKHLAPGANETRAHVRAAECSVDISHWTNADHYLTEALRTCG
jgi:hypothetical protein